MVYDLQTWSNLSQIISLVISVITLFLSFIIWIWPKPINLVQQIPPWFKYILWAILIFSLGFFANSLVPRATDVNSSSLDNKTLSIESLSISSVFAYSGKYDTKVGKGESSLSLTYDQNGNMGYVVSYSLPDEGDGYAGLAFRFFEPPDLTSFQFVEVVISFGDAQSRCDLAILDIYGQVNYIRLGENISSNSDITMNVNGEIQTIRVPLKTNFEHVNLKDIKEISFNAGTHFSRGQHTFTVREINFIRP